MNISPSWNPARRASRPLALSLAVLTLGALVIAAIWRDYGITWDESVHAGYGDRVLLYFLSGLRDTRCNDFLNFRFYGPLADLAGSLAARVAGDGNAFAARHLLAAATGLAALLGTLRLTFDLAGYRAALLATIALATMPRFHGNAFTNPKDIPLAAAFTWAMVALQRWAADPGPRWSRSVTTGVAVGVALAVRPGAAPLLGAIVAIATMAGVAGAARPTDWAIDPRDAARRIGSGGVVLCVAWAVMVAPWPWAHQAPFAHPWEAIREAANFSTTFDVLFEGHVYPSSALPRHYLPWYLLITTPPLTSVLAVAGLASVAQHFFRDPLSARGSALVAIWAVTPVVAVVVLRPNIYDGIRHFLFLLPALAVLAGIGADRLLRSFDHGAASRPATAAVLVALLSPLPTMARLHPYESTYFNALVGGLAGANGSYETDYWTQGYKEAVEWINAQPQPAGRRTSIFAIVNSYNFACAHTYLAPHVRMDTGWGPYPEADLPVEYDYFLAMTRYGADRNFPNAPVVHVVGRDGAAFAVIKARGSQQSGR